MCCADAAVTTAGRAADSGAESGDHTAAAEWKGDGDRPTGTDRATTDLRTG